MAHVALDLEGVLARTNETLIEEKINFTIDGDEPTVDDMTSWAWPIEMLGEEDYMEMTKDLWENGDIPAYVLPTSDIHNRMTRLYEDADSLDVVTARNNVDGVVLHEWLADNGIKYDSLEIVADAGEKAAMGYDIYIDDNPHLHKHLGVNQLQVLPERPWNDGIDRPKTKMFTTTLEAIYYVTDSVRESDTYTNDDEPSGDEMASMLAEDVSALLTDSRDTHGDAIENQQHIADGWTWYLRGKGLLGDSQGESTQRDEDSPTPRELEDSRSESSTRSEDSTTPRELGEDEVLTGSDAARMMAILKMSRSAVGDEDVDHDRDIAGYGSIAAADQVARGKADVDDLEEYTE